jgi:hypothetical protein
VRAIFSSLPLLETLLGHDTGATRTSQAVAPVS